MAIGLVVGCQSEKEKESDWTVESPDGQVKLEIRLQPAGKLQYKVLMGGDGQAVEVVETSPLGIVRQDQAFDSTLSFVSAESPRKIDETYRLSVGKQLENRNQANERTLSFKNPSGALLNLVIRAYNDGVAFRYVFPEKDNKTYTVTRELTGFQLPQGGNAWMQPYDSATRYSPGYERYYLNNLKVGATSPFPAGWCFPALFEVRDRWVLLTEAELNGNYFGAHLQPEAPGGMYTVRQPEPGEGKGIGTINAQSTLPWEMPWRVIMTGQHLATIVESNLVHHLSAPSRIADAGWVKPGRASWSWWSDNASSKDFNKLKTFVDLAAEMGWEYSLVDANWNVMEGGSLEQLAQYAQSKGIGLLAWYNSGGPNNDVTEQPRNKMSDPAIRKAEMQKLQQMGIKGIKVDFFQSDKQVTIQQYHDILKDAADHQIMVNFHGCTIPRGWSRTWPNLVSLESVRGTESYIFAPEYPEETPVHNVILPFTRNVVGPMDYTPVAFTHQKYPHLTSYGFELALSVVFESGIVHLADRVAAYRSLSAEPKQFLKNFPTAWDETRYLSGYPGRDLVLARRKGNDWYVGSLNAERKEKDLSVYFSFLGEGNYAARIIRDGKDNRSFASDSRTFTRSSKETVHILPIGGFVIKLSPDK